MNNSSGSRWRVAGSGDVKNGDKMRNFEELNVWKEAKSFALKVYEVSYSFPKEEIYGITSQLRRAVVSISNNVAEGCGKKTDKDFVSYLYNAMGSTKEVQSMLLLIKEIKIFVNFPFNELYNGSQKIGAMLYRLIKSTEDKN